jgi:glycerol-3-phosphate O-acyltransferase
MRLRDLLKFEFFFAEKESFRNEIRAELALHDPDWESRLASGPTGVQAIILRIRPFSAHRILRSFLEAYRVVADGLERRTPGESIDTAAFVAECLARAKQYRLQRRIRSDESVARVLFETALRLVRNRGLYGPGDDALIDARRAFAEELRESVRRVDGIEALAASRRAGIIP